MKKKITNVKAFLFAGVLALSTLLSTSCGAGSSRTTASSSSAAPVSSAVSMKQTSAENSEGAVQKAAKESSVLALIEKKSGWESHSQYDISIINNSGYTDG